MVLVTKELVAVETALGWIEIYALFFLSELVFLRADWLRMNCVTRLALSNWTLLRRGGISAEQIATESI